LIIKHFGGEIGKECNREDGQFEVKLDTSCLLFNELSPDQDVLLTHGDFAKMLPDCLIPIGWSGNVFTAISHTELPVFGLQFHPEVELTVNGSQILNNFLYKIANCKGLYQMSNREENCLQYIKRFVGDGHVLCLVSGGVDSAACTALITKALGSDRVTTVHIDNGFMRKDESSQVAESLNQIGINPQGMLGVLTKEHTIFTLASNVWSLALHLNHLI
jgi:GMP synthase (glutamine-hydrolysing)